MKDYLARMYREGKLDDTGLDAAVARGWITQAEADEIRAQNTEPV